ncbi:hypothetical protein LINPERHAP1_LOCUS37272 [Linum perenne]
MEEHKKRIAATAAVKTDRISALPDDIIHEILARLHRSLYGNAFKLSCLSKRWNQILLSYPILKVNDFNLLSKKPRERIAAAKSFKCVLSSDESFRRITVLHLKGCTFPHGISLEGMGISLEVLCLDSVRFLGHGILDTMITCASRLENLKLCRIDRRFQVANHPNLKTVKVGRKGFFFRVSSIANLKDLHIQSRYLKFEDLMKLIAEFPSLESIKYDDYQYHFDIVNTNKRREIEFRWCQSSNIVIEIDASGVDDFITSFLTILCKLDRKQIELVPFLAELSQFLVTISITSTDTNNIIWSYIPSLVIIDNLKFPSHLVDKYGSFLDRCLQRCHPKFMFFTRPEDQVPKNDYQLGLKRICKQLVERAQCFQCKGAYKCWHDELKDVKLVTRLTNGDIREDNVIDVSEDMLSSIVEGDEVQFRLTWH